MKRLTLVLVGLSLLALAAQRPGHFGQWDAYLPEEDTNPETTPYASSRVCRSCHPSQYQSWYESYHRTMTQWASPESIVPDWEGVEFGYQGRSYRLLRREDDFLVDMPKHGTAGVRPDERLELPVLMTTGSHQMQYYWLPVPWANAGKRIEGETEYKRSCAGCHTDGAEGGALEGMLLGPNDDRAAWDAGPHHRGLDDIGDGERRKIAQFLERIQFPGRVVQFPFVYFIRRERWLHDSHTFLQPEEPFSRVEPTARTGTAIATAVTLRLRSTAGIGASSSGRRASPSSGSPAKRATDRAAPMPSGTRTHSAAIVLTWLRLKTSRLKIS